MTPLSEQNVGELISSIRDIVFVIGVPYLGWKLRDWVQPGIDFFKRANEFFELGKLHMQKVDAGMQLLLNNHLTHIQSDLGHISGRQTRDVFVAEDAQPDSTHIEA